MKRATYKKSGVDISSMEDFKHGIKSMVRKSFRPEVLKDIGGFGSFFKFEKTRYKNPVLVSSSDGVGTKIKIAILAGRHDTVGIDAVAMNVNDILCCGAEPLFFLDYIAFSKLEKVILRDLIKGLSDGCISSCCSLIGCETAQMPGMYVDGEYDLAGFCVGVVEHDKIIDGSKISVGDAIIGIASSGLHSNGFSLVCKVFSEQELKRTAKELLVPTRIYVKPVLGLLKAKGNLINGISHITGGAFYDKIARILPSNIDAVINKSSWSVPKLFRLIQNKGSIKDEEMYHTLNMGIGMVIFLPKKSTNEVLAFLKNAGLSSWLIGEAVKGSGKVFVG